MDKNDFVKEKGKTLSELIEKYKSLLEEYKSYLPLERAYEDANNNRITEVEKPLTKEEQKKILLIIQELAEKYYTFFGIDLDEYALLFKKAFPASYTENTEETQVKQLRYNVQRNIKKILLFYNQNNNNIQDLVDRFTEAFPAVNYSDETKRNIEIYKQVIEDLLTEEVSFKILSNKQTSNCRDNHFFVRLESELVCVCCGESTKEYDLTEEELDFLTTSADKKMCLIKEADKDDIPFIKYILDLQERQLMIELSLNPPREEDDEFLIYDQAEEMLRIRRKLRKAHALDSNNYNGKTKVSNPKYLLPKRTKELLLEVNQELQNIKQSSSRFKDLMIEGCQTAKYEILILSGNNIPNLIEQAISKDEYISLAKAYYNLSNYLFRENTNYFKTTEEAISYDCLTANPKIYSIIKRMKQRGTN